MSIDCQGLLLGKVSTEEIANVVKQKLNCNVTIDKRFHGDEEGVMYYSEDKTSYTISNYIHFTYKDENSLVGNSLFMNKDNNQSKSNFTNILHITDKKKCC